MGTTVVRLLLSERYGVIGHIGDSRAYQMASGKLTQLTEDHTLVNELVKSGQISAGRSGESSAAQCADAGAWAPTSRSRWMSRAFHWQTGRSAAAVQRRAERSGRAAADARNAVTGRSWIWTRKRTG